MSQPQLVLSSNDQDENPEKISKLKHLFGVSFWH